MSDVFVLYVNPDGNRNSIRSYITDDESLIDFLDRIHSDLISMISDGYYIYRVEVT